jgi:hypothetical protein
MDKVFKVKLEDKAAFLNRLEKAGFSPDSTQIKDNKLEGFFTFTTSDPEQIQATQTILKQSSKINTMDKNKKSLKKDELKEMIRQTLTQVLEEKKEKEGKEEIKEVEDLDENLASEAAPILGTLLGVGGTLAVAIVRALMKAKTPEEKKRVLQSIAGQIEKSKGQDGL